MVTRSELAPFHGQRIMVTAFFDRLAQHPSKRTGQSEITALVQDTFYGEQRIFDHTYVQCAIGFQKFAPQRGERVQFTARVGTYQKYDQSTGKYHLCYNLEYPGDIVFLDRVEIEC